MSLLTCQDIAFSYEGKEVLSDINFNVNQGDYLCVVGENGAGKSTLLKGLLGLKSPSAGQILTGDGFRQKEIGYLPQQTQVQKDFPASVYEVVLSGCLNGLGKHLFYGTSHRQKAQKRMEELGILPIKNQCYRDLSGGQQQRVLLARALCATGQMLLLDEPVTGLDPLVAQEFYSLVKTLNSRERIAVIMVSHDINGAIKDANHVLHLGKRQLFFGTTEEYRQSELGKHFLEKGEAYDS